MISLSVASFVASVTAVDAVGMDAGHPAGLPQGLAGRTLSCRPTQSSRRFTGKYTQEDYSEENLFDDFSRKNLFYK